MDPAQRIQAVGPRAKRDHVRPRTAEGGAAPRGDQGGGVGRGPVGAAPPRGVRRDGPRFFPRAGRQGAPGRSGSPGGRPRLPLHERGRPDWRAFDLMVEPALECQVHGGLLKDKQFIQGFIADSYIDIQSARLVTIHAARKDRRRPRRGPDGHLRHQGGRASRPRTSGGPGHPGVGANRLKVSTLRSQLHLAASLQRHSASGGGPPCIGPKVPYVSRAAARRLETLDGTDLPGSRSVRLRPEMEGDHG